MVVGLLCLLYFNLLTIAKPVAVERNDTFVAKSERSLFWGWAWGTESTVSIVDRTPPISFSSRPGAWPSTRNEDEN
jgi:E3 ubiquitin-protein ligase RNF13/E3 ubiquitin-protein ligase RNF167